MFEVSLTVRLIIFEVPSLFHGHVCCRYVEEREREREARYSTSKFKTGTVVVSKMTFRIQFQVRRGL